MFNRFDTIADRDGQTEETHCTVKHT